VCGDRQVKHAIRVGDTVAAVEGCVLLLEGGIIPVPEGRQPGFESVGRHDEVHGRRPSSCVRRCAPATPGRYGCRSRLPTSAWRKSAEAYSSLPVSRCRRHGQLWLPLAGRYFHGCDDGSVCHITLTRSLLPFASRMTISRHSKSRSLTRKRPGRAVHAKRYRRETAERPGLGSAWMPLHCDRRPNSSESHSPQAPVGSGGAASRGKG